MGWEGWGVHQLERGPAGRGVVRTKNRHGEGTTECTISRQQRDDWTDGACTFPPTALRFIALGTEAKSQRARRVHSSHPLIAWLQVGLVLFCHLGPGQRIGSSRRPSTLAGLANLRDTIGTIKPILQAVDPSLVKCETWPPMAG